jgi:hypothetical protein
MEKVKSELRDGLKIGDVINVSPQYLENAICMFVLNFVLIAAELWKQLDSSSEERAEVLMNIGFDSLMKERYPVCEGISYFMINDKKVPEINRLIGQVNYWLTLKCNNRFEEIKGEIEQTDYSAKDPIFRLAKYCLLDDYKTIFKIMPEMLINKDLKHSQLETWPLFKNVRAQQEYIDFREAHKKDFENID